jgi:hypothetical protein
MSAHAASDAVSSDPGKAGGIPKQEDVTPKPVDPKKRHDMTWHDHLIMLLHMGASIEHALMVQYLYAAYSLGGEQVPEKHRPMIQEWQETILAVAREEMGHLLTVQNILTLLGAGINLVRENFPWDVKYYPFPFVLEPLTRASLACYVYAEMPLHEKFDERKEIEKLASIHTQCDPVTGYERPLHPVGEIYTEIIAVIGDSKRIPDSAFRDESFSVQASWDDWGRGYKPDPRPLDDEGSLIDATPQKADQFRAHVMIDRVATRTQALAALQAISVQGEGPHGSEIDGEWSHFKRFIKMFREFETIKDEPWSPSRPVPVNPNTLDDPKAPNRAGYIAQHTPSREWAELFNLRYRMLLTYLSHTFQVARVTRADVPNVRAILMHRVFAEMYNLKTISGILVQLPLHAGDPGAVKSDTPRSGPPFEMPYNLRIPPAESDVWSLHLDILGSAQKLCRIILSKNPRPEDKAYLETLFDLDNQTRAWITSILGGFGPGERCSA